MSIDTEVTQNLLDMAATGIGSATAVIPDDILVNLCTLMCFSEI